MPFLAPVFASLLSSTFLTQLLVGAALSLGGTLLSNLLAPPAEAQRDPGVSLTVQIGANQPLSLAVGIAATAGHRIYAGSWGDSGGTPNANYVDVLELSNVPIDGLNGAFAAGERTTILYAEAHAEFGFPIQQGRVNGVDHLWVKFYDGTQTAADPYLRSRFGAHATRPYTANMVGYGTSYAIVTSRFNRELWQGRPPEMLFEIRGIKCYDIRRDSTAGGSGAHRRNNSATWEFTLNPYVISYNTVFMGVYYGSEWVWGLQGLPANRLPTSAWIAAMNECDRTLPDWSNQTQFEVGGIIYVDQQPASFLDDIAKSTMGRMIESAGTYKPRCGLPGAAVWSFGEASLSITDPRVVTPFPGLEATHNTIEGSYMEPGETWKIVPAPTVRDAALIVSDGNRELSAGVTYPLVNRNEQAQRLNYSYLYDGRRFRTFQATFHPISWLLEPGDVIDGTLVGEGYEDKAFEILEMSGRRTFMQTMTLREVDPADFDPPSSAYQPWAVGPVQTIYPTPQPGTGISFDEYTLYDNSMTARRPGIIGFYQGGMDDVAYFAVEVRRPGDLLPFFVGEFPYSANLLAEQPIVSNSFVPAMALEVRGKYVPYTARQTNWTTWLSVTTPNVKLVAGVDFDPYSGVVDFDTIGPGLTAWIARMAMTARELIDALQTVATNVGDQETANNGTFSELRTELSTAIGVVNASFEQTITVAIVPLQNEVIALADYLTELSAGDGVDVSTARFRMTTVSGSAGYSTIGAQTRVDTADPMAWRGAAWFLETPNNPALPTRFLVNADQFIVVSGSNTAQPLIFDSGGLKLQVANIGLVRAGRMESADSKFVIDLDLKRISIST